MSLEELEESDMLVATIDINSDKYGNIQPVNLDDG